MATDTIAVQLKPAHPKAAKMLPLILFAAVIIIDQISKYLIVKYIPLYTVGASYFGDLIRIIHVSNPGIAFSIGQGWSTAIRSILFRVLPLLVIIVVIVIYFRNDTFTKLQRWSIMGIAGGGLGNLIDRFFRAEGVVDFIDVKFFGIFGLDRWPTFNAADSAVVVCGILLVVSFIVSSHKNGKAA
jgi:signal peptidase II